VKTFEGEETHMPDLVPLQGSERSQLPDAQPAGELDVNASITVTVMLRRRASVPEELITGPETLTSSQLGERYGADPADVALATEVFARYGLTVPESSPASLRLKVRGTIAQLTAAFGTTLTLVSSPHPDGTGAVVHRYRSGSLSVPAELAGVVTAVLGLDNRPVARPQFRTLAARTRMTPQTMAPEAAPAPTAGPAAVPLTAPQVASFYKFPADFNGSGQTIAIIELGGGYSASDLNSYFSGLSLPTPSVTAVGVDGGSNSYGQQADGEVELDIEVAGAVAPGAAQVVYFTTNTDQGFIDAISEAVHATPTPIVVSISWGGPEDSWSPQSRTAMDTAIADAAVLGTTVCVAAGDNGSSDNPNSQSGVQVDFPASSPHALACGGTQLVGDVSTDTITSEVVWNELANNEGAGGGGVSTVFTPLPSWQDTAGVAEATGVSNPGRGVPDVAGNADPVTGYLVVVDGSQPQPIGGTSAVAPLWAGLIARLAQATGKKFGLLQPLIYAGVKPGVAAPGFNDIVEGNNGAYEAVPGWDACTGLGSPDGQALLTLLSS
jgi:kumamolisin